MSTTLSETSFVEVFHGDYRHASLIKQLLKKNNIQSFTRNILIVDIDPVAVNTGGINIRSIDVSYENYKLALKLIDNFKDLHL